MRNEPQIWSTDEDRRAGDSGSCQAHAELVVAAVEENIDCLVIDRRRVVGSLFDDRREVVIAHDEGAGIFAAGTDDRTHRLGRNRVKSGEGRVENKKIGDQQTLRHSGGRFVTAASLSSDPLG
ncbi:MAG: hypothetical protein ACJAR2_002186 [Ilumatobacter sp.]|jgi:hypothetical protein